MSRNKEVLQLMKDQNDFFKKGIGFNFPDDDGSSSWWKNKVKRLQNRLLDRDKWTLADDYLIDFSGWYLNYSQYAWVKLRDKDLQRKCFAHSAWCSYQAIKVRHEIARIRQINNVHFFSGQVLFWWSNLLLVGWQDEADEIINLALESTYDSGVKAIMHEGGYSLDTFSFFLMELYCLSKDRPFNRKDYDHTEDDGLSISTFIYNPMLENWNTTDLGLVDELITQMCDYHVSRTVEEPEDIPEDEEDYYEFSDIEYRLYPFEVLAWLKIRELSGLDNPKDFFHPLMNQALAEPVSDKPLAKPVEDKETNQILELVRKHFPEAIV